MGKDDLRRRLGRLTGDGPGRPATDDAAAGPTRDVDSARERLRRLLQSKGRGLEFSEALSEEKAPRAASGTRRENLEELVDGDWRETAHGRVFVVERHYPLEQRHAGEALGGLLRIGERALEILEGRPTAGFSFRRAVFLDTETTGLAGGTGTLPFLVGVGRFTDGGYHFRQLFIDSPAAERGQLELLGEWLGDCGGLVTYNGRSFDWPLLRDRYLLSGLRPGFLSVEPPHIDILAWVRRLWRHRLPRCSLKEAERGILELHRHDDVEGCEIPPLYFAYLRGAPVGERLARVFYHNELDILSLPILASRALRLVENPLEHCEEATELYSAGRLEALAPQRETLWEAALEKGLGEEMGRRAALDLSLHYKRAGDYERARRLWERLRRGPYERGPYEEEAKYLEHHLRDNAAALELVEEALSRARRVLRNPQTRPRELGELEHRRARLIRKLGDAPSPPTP